MSAGPERGGYFPLLFSFLTPIRLHDDVSTPPSPLLYLIPMEKKSPPVPSSSPAIAVIDIGSYLDPHDHCPAPTPAAGCIPLEFLQQAVSLGKDTFTKGNIEKGTIEDCVRALKNFRRVLEEYGVTQDERVRAVATTAVREAANRDAFHRPRVHRHRHPGGGARRHGRHAAHLPLRAIASVKRRVPVARPGGGVRNGGRRHRDAASWRRATSWPPIRSSSARCGSGKCWRNSTRRSRASVRLWKARSGAPSTRSSTPFRGRRSGT